jgi:hypothetical protein
MRYDDATFDRDHRWIEGHVALSTPHVASHAGVEQAMCFDLLSKEAFSNA